MRFLSPTHVFILGDLFSSQYLDDREFYKRLSRFNWIFDQSFMSVRISSCLFRYMERQVKTIC
jgi:hypothetical protein